MEKYVNKEKVLCAIVCQTIESYASGFVGCDRKLVRHFLEINQDKLLKMIAVGIGKLLGNTDLEKGDEINWTRICGMSNAHEIIIGEFNRCMFVGTHGSCVR